MAAAIADPGGHRRRAKHRAHRLDLGEEEAIARLDLGAGEAVAGKVAETDNGGAADRAAMRLDQAAGGGGECHGEGLPALAQSCDGAVEAAGRFGLQPRTEGEEAGAVDRRARALGQPAGNQRRLARRPPGNEALVLALDDGLGAIGRRDEVGDAETELGVLELGPIAGAHQRDRAEHGEADRADQDGKEKDLPGAAAVAEEPGRGRGLRLGGSCKKRYERCEER